MARNGGSRIFVWALLAMIIVGLIGFGSTNLSGSIRTIGKVGDKDLPISTYARALQNEIRALEAQTGQTIPFAQAQAFGLDQQVLSRIISGRLLDAEATRVGISVGDETLREQLIQISSFQGIDGKFDRTQYKLTLDNAGLSEAEYEAQLRDEIASSILQTAVLGNIKTNPSYAQTIARYLSETRDVTWSELTPADLDAAVPAPTDAQIQAYYDANIADFTLPETRQITYAWITPDMLIDTVELDEQSLKDAYQRRYSEFNTEERRLVERLIFPDVASAQNAADRLAKGEVTFEDLVAERNLELVDVDMGDVTKSDLGAAGDAVFSTDNLGVVGPIDTPLGAALFRVNGILAGQSTPFEEALPALREELALERARRVIDSQWAQFDDELAAGATLEELARDTEMQLGKIAYHSDMFDGIAGYEAFRQAAANASAKQFPEIGALDDGGLFALRLDGIEPAKPAPLDAVRDDVIAAWTAQKQLELLTAKAEDLKTALASGAEFEALGLTAHVETALGRRNRPDGLPSQVATAAFDLSQIGALAILPAENAVYIARLDAIVAPDLTLEDNQRLIAAIEQQSESGLQQDVFAAFGNAVRSRTEITLDQQAINAVHANFQ